jgi:hypothetical protein
MESDNLSGSRYYDGNVPGVYWVSVVGRLYVNWNGPDDASGSLRARQVVS